MRIQLNVSNSLEDSPGAGSPEGTGLREERWEGDPNIVPPLQRPKSKLFKRRKMKLKVLRVRAPVACEQQTHFPVVASLPPKNSYFLEGEKRQPEMRLLFAG